MVRHTAVRAAIELGAAHRSARAEMGEKKASDTLYIIGEIQKAIGEMYTYKEPALLMFSKRVSIPAGAKPKAAVALVKQAMVRVLGLAASLETHSSFVEDTSVPSAIPPEVESVSPSFYHKMVTALPQIRHEHPELLLSFYKDAEAFGGDRPVRRALQIVLSAHVNGRVLSAAAN